MCPTAGCAPTDAHHEKAKSDKKAMDDAISAEYKALEDEWVDDDEF